MSALGQKRTCAVQNVMSALPPIADMCSALRHVRFVPIADVSVGYKNDHEVNAAEWIGYDALYAYCKESKSAKAWKSQRVNFKYIFNSNPGHSPDGKWK